MPYRKSKRSIMPKQRLATCSSCQGKNVVDLMDKAFSKFQSDGKKIIDDTFISKVFNNIAKKVKPFEEYMEFILEHKKSSPT